MTIWIIILMTYFNIYQESIEDHYRDRRAERSNVLYMDHIEQGVSILHAIDATEDSMNAFRIHPILQVPTSLKVFDVSGMDPRVVLLAMEYRNKANAYVCRKRTDGLSMDEMPVMILPEVTEMLVADKIQNYKDFLLYHQSHPRAVQLDKYFKQWLTFLGVKPIIGALEKGESFENILNMLEEGSWMGWTTTYEEL